MASTNLDYNGQWTAISAAGTSLVTAGNGILHRVIIPGTYVGTVQLDDAAATAGTTTTSNFLTIGLPASGIPNVVEAGVNFKKGLVYQATGTPTVTLVWN